MKSQEITRKDCREKMKLRQFIVTDKFRDIVNKEPGPTPTRYYFSPAKKDNPRNAFLFDRRNILRIFFTDAMVARLDSEIDSNAPTHLLAILGAHIRDNEEDKVNIGQSTVIVMGVKSNDGATIGRELGNAVNVPIRTTKENGSKLSDDDVIVGFEYPPSTGIPDSPPSGNPITEPITGPMTFKFLP